MATTVESLRKAVGKKKNSRAFAWLADLMRQNGDLDAALSCVQAGLSATPCEEGNLVLSKILAEKQDWDGVIEACEFVLCRNPYCLSAIRRLGDAYAEKGDEEKRNRYYRLLHDLDPLDAFWKEEYAPKIEMAEEIPELEDSPEMAPPVVAEPQAEALEQDAPVASVEEQTDEEKSEEKDEDPFSSLATLLPADEDGDSEVSFRDLENSLDNAIADFSPANGEKDEFPTDEIDGNDISAALSGIFGSAETDGPLPEQGEKADESSSEEKIEDKPQSLSDAFDSLFGEDELPDEFVLSTPSNHVPASDSTQSSKTSEDSAPSEASPSESSSLFTKSIETSPSAVGLEKSVESSFDSLFDEETDDLPLESLGETSKPAADSASRVEPSIEVSPSQESEASTPSEPLALEPSPLFEKSAEEPSKPESTLEKSVESSFDSLFGEETDDLPLESLGEASKPAADSASRVEPSIEVSPVPEKEDSTSEPLASEPSPLFEKSAEEPSKPESTLEKSVESSFDSLFGEESDDALAEDSTTSTRTLAEIYFEQGVYDEAIKIYKDLLRKNPEDVALKDRLLEIEKTRDDRQKEN